jgi:hypothetical protein
MAPLGAGAASTEIMRYTSSRRGHLTQDLDFPDAFRKDIGFDTFGVARLRGADLVAAPSEDTKSQAMRKVRSRSAREILDNRISIVGYGA